jgi:hypothetical protein
MMIFTKLSFLFSQRKESHMKESKKPNTHDHPGMQRMQEMAGTNPKTGITKSKSDFGAVVTQFHPISRAEAKRVLAKNGVET